MRSISLPLILLAFLLITSYVRADAFLVDPVVVKATTGKIIDAGSVQPGEEMELIFSTDSGYGSTAKWLQATYGDSGFGGLIVPQNSDVGTKSLITRISVSTLLPEGEYQIPLTLHGDPNALQNETYSIHFTVSKTLFSATLENPQVEGKLNERLHYSLVLVNDSSASSTISIQPTLPVTWTAGQTLTLKPHSFQNITLDVTPRFAGPKSFDIQFTNAQTGQRYDTLHATVVANASIKDHYSAGLYGFPFFTISLVANYLANAFFSLAL